MGEYGYTWARARHIGNLNLTNFRKNNQNVRSIEGWLMNFFSFLWCDVALPSISGSE